MRKKYMPPNLPFVEARYRDGWQKPTAIVIRSSQTASTEGVALGRATMWHKRTSPLESYHYVIDEGKTYHCVPDNVVAIHSGSGINSKSAIGISICCPLLESLEQWDDQKHAKVLERTVDLVARLVLAYKINVQYLDSVSAKRWYKRRRRSRGGIIVQIEGSWPITTFMNELRAKVADLKVKN